MFCSGHSVLGGPDVASLLSLRVRGQGGKEYLMRAHFGLPSVQNEEDAQKPPINVKFEIPYFTVSGIQVSCLCM